MLCCKFYIAFAASLLGIIVGSMHSRAAPFSEKQAFCIDRVDRRHYSLYEHTKAYNICINNADSLIPEYEQQRSRQRQEQEERSRRYDQQRRIKEALSKEKEQLKERQFDDVFSSFD